jgi:hypothetical protein
MSAADDARAAAHRAAHCDLLEWPARVGFVGYGVVHLIVAWMALETAWGQPPEEGGHFGAFQRLAAQPFGRWLLISAAVGFTAMTVWQLLEAAVGHRSETGGERLFERACSMARAVIYAVFAWTVVKVLRGSAKSTADYQQEATANTLAGEGGQWMVGVAGVGVIGFSVSLAVYGLLRRFEKHLHTERMSVQERRAVRGLGVVGYTAKGVGYAIVGVLLVIAALTFDPSRSRGLDAALQTLAGQSYGHLILAVIAAGIAAFGIFCLAQARYRKI